MKVAGDRAAGRAGYPEVRAAGVEDNLEFLCGRANGDCAEVCIEISYESM